MSKLVLGLLPALLITIGCTNTEVKSGLEAVDPLTVAPPATAGSADALVGTTWEWGEGKTLSFSPDGKGDARGPASPPSPMNYTVQDNGVIAVVVGESSQAGTWDGEQLILGGRPLKRLE